MSSSSISGVALTAGRGAEGARASRAAFHVQVIDSLRGLSDAELDRVTSGASVFFDRRWLRLLDELDLGPLLHGAVSFRYAVVRRDGELQALCPFFVTESPSIHLAYSFEKTYFSGWPEELARIDPRKARLARWLSRLLAGLRRASQLAGIWPSKWIVAVSPLSFRGGVAVAPLASADRAAATRALLGALQAVAEDEGAAAWFYRFPAADQELRDALGACGFDELFLLQDSVIEDLDGGLEGYLRRFQGTKRRKLKSEIAKAKSSGLRFESAKSVAGLEPEIARLYAGTYAKYGPEYFAHPPSFWSSVAERLGPCSDFVLAYRGEQLVGFTLLLHKNGDLWAYRCGKLEEERKAGDFLYFSLGFYEPMRRAAELSAKRLWLGPGAWGTKHHRGAVGVPLHGAFYFPRRATRAALLPYLRLFSRGTQHELRFMETASESVKQDPSA